MRRSVCAITSVSWWLIEKCPTGFLTLYLYTSNGDPQRVIVVLSSALAVLIPIDILRLRYPSLEYAFEKCAGVFMRDSEKVRVCADDSLALMINCL